MIIWMYLFLQVVSRGQIQHSQSLPVEFYHYDLNRQGLNLIEPMKVDWSKEELVTGITYIKIKIPPTMSPKIEVIPIKVSYKGIFCEVNLFRDEIYEISVPMHLRFSRHKLLLF